MTVTIQQRDWKKRVSYDDPCGCLLARAVKRTLRTRRYVAVWAPGMINVDGKKLYTYNERKYESRLIAAHHDPSLLPMTITLR